MKPSFEDKLQTDNKVFLTQVSNIQEQLAGLGVIIFNCVFGEKNQDWDKVLRVVHVLKDLKNNCCTLQAEELQLFMKQYPLLIVIMKRIDFKVLEFIINLLQGKFKDAKSVLGSSFFYESVDGVFKNDLSILELIRTFTKPECLVLKNQRNSERVISSKFATNSLKLLVEKVIERIRFQIQNCSIEERNILFRNWTVVNERSAFVKEVAESLGLSRKRVLAVLKNYGAKVGIGE